MGTGSTVSLYFSALFGLVLLSVLVVSPMLTSFQTAQLKYGINATGSNVTSSSQNNATFANSTQAVILSNPCVSFDVKIPLPLLDQFSLNNVKFCLPVIDGNFISNPLGQIGFLIPALIALGVGAAVAGYVTGGESKNTFSVFGFALVICGFFLSLIGSIYGMFAAIPIIGVPIVAVITFAGFFLIYQISMGLMAGNAAV